jgi:hypothetical protein
MTLSRAKRLPGVNAFEISDIRDEETKAAVIRGSECNHVTLL